MTLQTRTDRQVPFDEPAEQQVLGALLIDRDAIFKIADVLATDDFYVARHQRIYGAIYELLQRRERIDTLTVQVELARREELDRVGGAAYLADLVARVATAMEIERHAHVVRDKAILRRLLGAATQIAADAYSEPTDMPITLDKAEQRLFALRDDTANTQLRHIQTALQDNFQHLSDRMDRPYEVSGIPSGFRELDFYTEGFTQGDLVVLGARPSVGKTSLALALAFNIAKHGHPTLIFSLEMDTKQIVSRFLAMNSRSDLLARRRRFRPRTEALDPSRKWRPRAGLRHRPHALEGQRGHAARRPAPHPWQRREEPQRPDGPVLATVRVRTSAVLQQGAGYGHAGMTLDLVRTGPKPPPEKPEAEASLIGAILIDARVYEEAVRGRIAPAELSREPHRLILGA